MREGPRDVLSVAFNREKNLRRCDRNGLKRNYNDVNEGTIELQEEGSSSTYFARTVLACSCGG